MSSDTWGAATFALGVLVTAHSAAVFGEPRPPAKAVIWTATAMISKKRLNTSSTFTLEPGSRYANRGTQAGSVSVPQRPLT
jgi:hypothetical protein